MIMKIMSLFVLVAMWLLLIGLVHAEGGCPPGMIPHSGNDISSCGPIPPGYGGNQQRQQAPQAPLGIWSDNWGALARYPTGGVLGTATNMATRNAAEQAAMADCQAKGGGSNCKMELWYRNECAAFTTSDTGFYSTAEATLAAAVQAGMATCTKSGEPHCRTYYSACSLPVRVQ